MAYLEWIDAINPSVNAICTLDAEGAVKTARAADARLAREPARPLEGLPVAIKDLAETRGMRTTYASPLFTDNVPDFDALHVARVRAAGANIIGKTNTPEWGAGSQTFNTLFGTTATPYAVDRTAGGSSGGAAAAVAARMLPLADGSDLGGSLRNPAAFCNVMGFRPSPGRVPNVPDRTAWNPLPVVGPMARSVPDLGRLLSVMAGPDIRAPLSLVDNPAAFDTDYNCRLDDVPLAFSLDLGFLPVAPDVADVVAQAPAVFEQLGCRVEHAHPDLRDAPEIFQVLRALGFVASYASYYRSQPDQLKDTVRWNIERGLALTPEDIGRAQVAHQKLLLRVTEFFDTYHYLILPATQVPPFDKTLDWPRGIGEVRFDNYLEWMEICSAITLTGCPVVCVPCGFTADGLPVGLQVVGPPRADRAVLSVAHMYARATGFAEREPDYAQIQQSRRGEGT